MFYAKWMEDLDKLDTPLVKQSRYKEYWYILEIAGGFISWKPKHWILNLLYSLALNVNMFYYVPCLIVSAFKVDDLGEIGQYLNYMALILIAQTTNIMMIYNQANIIGMFQTCLDGFYDYKEEGRLTNEIKTLMGQFKFFKNVLKVVIPIYLALIAGSVMISDYIDAAFNFETFVNDTYVNGVYQNLPLKMWYFHTIESQFDRYLMILSEIFCSGEMAMAITTADLVMIFFGQELILQQKILQTACADMDKRANALYRKRFGREPSECPLLRSKDGELMTCYKCCLKKIAEHHLVISKYVDMYKAILNWPSGMVVLDGSISIAMSALSLMQGRGQPSLEVTSCLLLLAEIVSMFILNEIGQTVKDLSEDIFDAMYSFKWMDCSKAIQKDFLSMKQLLGRPIVIKAGSLTPLNRDTFSMIMSSAYSYLNLMRASAKEQEIHN